MGANWLFGIFILECCGPNIDKFKSKDMQAAISSFDQKSNVRNLKDFRIYMEYYYFFFLD